MLFYSTPCQSISNAGLQHGFVEGSGTRSSIIWNVRDAVKIKRPKYLILENVKAMISDKFVGMFNLWQSELLKFGYTNFPQVLNAKDYGVPQNRERIFLVSVHGDAWFNFPQPQELKLRLKDVHDEDIEVMKASGLSNSALYKLAGNSIVCACMEGIFTQLFRTDSDSLF